LLMVKPALSYMDIIWRVKQATNLPLQPARNVLGVIGQNQVGS
ncbi:MAG: hypothetical protein F6K04_26175, partial [Leptolyngbya sp. SIO4C5]|nr:hypothetical protein [Leptolyngbya sp. SIO4C5]